MKTVSPPAAADLPDTLPGLLMLHQELSCQLSRKKSAASWQESQAGTLVRQNESLKRQLLDLYCLTERLALAFKGS